MSNRTSLENAPQERRRRLSIDELRRSSPLDPTRTLRLSEQESSSRENTPIRILRPRSNPRTRTPRRYESPLDPSELRREGLQESSEEDSSSRRITIRPLAGSAVGTALPNRVPEDKPADRSSKQGPSHRKIRRWNNDHFASLAAEIKANRGHVAAEALLKSMADMHLYKNVYDPSDKTNPALQTLMHDPTLAGLKEEFYDGGAPLRPKISKVRPSRPRTADDHMNRLDNRLRPVIIKACVNSGPAASVVKRFEAYLTSIFFTSSEPTRTRWTDLLLEAPVVHTRSHRTTVQFSMDAQSATGGFNRLLLHALAQFHGLQTTSRSSPQAKMLLVSQQRVEGAPPFLLLSHILATYGPES